jgi:hypothetical protein
MKLNQIHEKVVSVSTEVAYTRLLLDKIKPQVVDKDLSYDEVEEIFNKYFRPFGVLFDKSTRFYNNFDSSNDAINVCLDGGSYDLHTGFITIQFLDDVQSVVADSYRWTEFVQILCAILGHELVHRQQVEKANIEKIKAPADPYHRRKYLSHRHEIMAYAQQAAYELQAVTGYSPDRIINMLKSIKDTERQLFSFSYPLRNYLETFEEGDPVRRRFLKQMIEYLEGDIEA